MSIENWNPYIGEVPFVPLTFHVKKHKDKLNAISEIRVVSSPGDQRDSISFMDELWGTV